MNVTCPACRTVYRVDPRKVPAGGIRARCLNCAGEFVVEDAFVSTGVTDAAESGSAWEGSAATAAAVFAAAPQSPAGDDRHPADEPTEPHPSVGSGVTDDAPDSAAAGYQELSADSETTEHLPSAGDFSSEEPFGGALDEQTLSSERESSFADENQLAEEDAGPGSALYPDLSGIPDVEADQPLVDISQHGDEVHGVGAAHFSGDGTTAGGAVTEAADAAAQTPPAEPGEFDRSGAAGPGSIDVELPPSPFGSSDPRARARRLARALVSDIVVYHPDRRERALREGTLRREFHEEIRKSWDEYVAQVGNEIALGTTYFKDALNELLAGGGRVF